MNVCLAKDKKEYKTKNTPISDRLVGLCQMKPYEIKKPSLVAKIELWRAKSG